MPADLGGDIYASRFRTKPICPQWSLTCSDSSKTNCEASRTFAALVPGWPSRLQTGDTQVQSQVWAATKTRTTGTP